MDTNELIRSLAADHGWRARPVGIVLAIALAVALPFTMMMFMMRLGMRPDFMAATANPFFVLKFVVTLALVFASVVLAARLVRPGADIRKAAWLLGIPVLLLAGGIAADAVVMTSPWTKRLIGTNSLICLSAIPALSLPLLIAALIGLRHGAATRPMLTGAVAGLLAGGNRRDVLRLALHRRLAAVRRHLVQHRAGGGRAGRGGCGALGAADLERRLALASS